MTILTYRTSLLGNNLELYKPRETSLKDSRAKGENEMSNVFGTAGNDILTGGQEADYIWGFAGNDTVYV